MKNVKKNNLNKIIISILILISFYYFFIYRTEQHKKECLKLATVIYQESDKKGVITHNAGDKYINQNIYAECLEKFNINP